MMDWSNPLKKIALVIVVIVLYLSFERINDAPGTILDSFNEVNVYSNGSKFTNVFGRNISVDGYNLGLKYQCVEFVKRYYYKVYAHKMPDSYGHAKDYFDKSLADSAFNERRGLVQFKNVREYAPMVGDIVVYDAVQGNPFGHVAIIYEVNDSSVAIIQQNMGKNTRKTIPYVVFEKYHTLADYNLLGWLRKQENNAH